MTLDRREFLDVKCGEKICDEEELVVFVCVFSKPAGMLKLGC
jgi:hypothetical protein